MTTPLQTSAGGRQTPQPTGDSRSNRTTTPHLSEESRAKAREAVAGLRDSAAGNVDRIAAGFDAAASQLDGGQVGQLSGYIHEMADKLSGFSRELRDKSGDDMLHKVSRLAKENPALFLTSSVAAGFALSRFARASRPDHSREGGTQSPVHADKAHGHLNDGADSTCQSTSTSSCQGGTSS